MSSREVKGRSTPVRKEEQYPCGTCNKPVRDNQNGLQCDLCEVWFHAGCQGVQINEYRLYTSKECKAKWFCHQCDDSYRNLKKDNKAMKERNKELMATNNELEAKVQSLESKIEELKQQLKQEIMQEVLEEMEERSEKEKKKNNLIIFNVEEADHETLQERNREDSSFCETLLKEIGSDIQAVDIVEVTRLGKGGS